MAVRVSRLFPAKFEEPFNMARHMLTDVLPMDCVWSVDYSIKYSQFNCATKVASQDMAGYELGVVLKFRITKDCELYATELVPSKKGSCGLTANSSVNNTGYSAMKAELMKKTTRRYRAELKSVGIRCEF